MNYTTVDPDNLASPSRPLILQVLGSRPYVPLIWLSGFCALWFFKSLRNWVRLSRFPLISGSEESFTVNARGVVERGFKQLGPSKPFRVISELGQMLILPPSMANDVRNDPNLSFDEYMKESTCAYLPGFEPFHESTKSSLLNDMVKIKLNPNLSKVTAPLNHEANIACKDVFHDSKIWHEVMLKNSILDLVARLTARVFLGDEEISHNPAWLRITKEYTVDSFLTSYHLRTYPKILRRLVHWFLPRAQKVRAQLQEAEALIKPVLAKRHRAKTSEKSRGFEESNSIEWFEQVAREKKLKYRAAALQLILATSAIHTTTDLLTQTIYELLQNPEIIKPLREEIISVVSDGGLKHSSLYNLKLMDSVIKEAQRIKPPMSVNMNRVAIENVRLKDGSLIPKGTQLGVSGHASWDPEVFPHPEKFDGYRFLRLQKQPGNENAWQLNTTRPEHIAFGHGRHACPGRFLAANEIKIALCHILIKYDMKLSPSTPAPKIMAHGIMLDSDPTTRVMLRRRESEVEL